MLDLLVFATGVVVGSLYGKKILSKIHELTGKDLSK